MVIDVSHWALEVVDILCVPAIDKRIVDRNSDTRVRLCRYAQGEVVVAARDLADDCDPVPGWRSGRGGIVRPVKRDSLLVGCKTNAGIVDLQRRRVER